MAILQLLDHLPETNVHGPGRVWDVVARTLGERGVDGRTAQARRRALAGACPSPISPASPPGKSPADELFERRRAEAVEAGQARC